MELEPEGLASSNSLLRNNLAAVLGLGRAHSASHIRMDMEQSACDLHILLRSRSGRLLRIAPGIGICDRE